MDTFMLEQASKEISKLKMDNIRLESENKKLRGDYSGLTVDQIDEENKTDLREISAFYGGWDKLRKVIAQLEDNDNEAAYERAMNRN